MVLVGFYNVMASVQTYKTYYYLVVWSYCVANYGEIDKITFLCYTTRYSVSKMKDLQM